MKIRVLTASLIGIAILSTLFIIEPYNELHDYSHFQEPVLPLFSQTPLTEGNSKLHAARLQWQLQRLADPATGVIPKGIRKKELAYVKSLNIGAKKSSQANPEFDWKSLGPHNVGGRTRAFAIDITNENVMLAGGVSGGLWRSIDAGITWSKVTAPDEHHSITCIAQDSRVGKTNIWYYGTGEAYGNSASKSFSANYLGNGVYKSTDGGLNWDTLGATISGTPEKFDAWDHIWRVAIDASIDTADIVYAALEKHLYRSIDGGSSWTVALDATGVGGTIFTEVAVTPGGVVYATLSGGNDKGIWRSGDHGNTWAKISEGSGWPSNFNRAVIGYNPMNENTIYFLSNTPNYGQFSETFFGGSEYNSLWKYRYVTGDGADSNGVWTDLSTSIPAGGPAFNNFNAQGSYNLVVAVKPDDSNTVFIGGTNIYRSDDGFTTPNNTTQIGGYKESTVLPYFQMYPDHHPDNHVLAFLPSDPSVLFSANDGGVFRTDNSLSSNVEWVSLNNGYRTTQFYTVAIDHGPTNSDIVFGGLQDNGTYWTDSPDPLAPWVMPSTGDGAFCALSNDGTFYYFSRQNGKVLKAALDQNGTPTAFNRIDPITGDGGDYLFINPFILDPTDNNIMYLAEMYDLWRNDDLASIPMANEYDSISTGWSQFSNVSLTSSYITALGCSKTNPEHRLYYGTNNSQIYRIDSAHTGDPTTTNIKNNIANGGYTSCIAIDPRDADKVLVVYSNYGVYSLWYTEDGGGYWHRVAGNLETGPPVGAPSWMVHLGDGPSCRWVSIIPMGPDSTLYLLGTSVGLFTTYELIPDSTTADSTNWMPQAAMSIGNVVADMIDYREADGFVAVGTHGTGIYTTHLFDEPTSTRDALRGKSEIKVEVFPNPASERATFRFELREASTANINIYDSSGKKIAELVNTDLEKGVQHIDFNTSELSAGVYLYSLTTNYGSKPGRLIVN